MIHNREYSDNKLKILLDEFTQNTNINKELKMKNEIKKRQNFDEFIMMRTELGKIGGAGHFFGNDKVIIREEMKEKELAAVLRLLSLGEKKVNLKEREFIAFRGAKTR